MKIKFLPQNIEIESTPEKSLLQLAGENQLEIRSICKGVPSCAECRIKIVEGENNVLPPTKAELSLIGTNYFIDGRRLSCQVRCFGDITVDLTEQIEKSEHQTKKIRGFRTSKQMESKAVNDTLLLDEKDQLQEGSSSPRSEAGASESGQSHRGPDRESRAQGRSGQQQGQQSGKRPDGQQRSGKNRDHRGDKNKQNSQGRNSNSQKKKPQ